MRGTTLVPVIALLACSGSHQKVDTPEDGKVACEVASDCPSDWYCLGAKHGKHCYSTKNALADAGSGGRGDRDAAASDGGGQDAHSGGGGQGAHSGVDAAPEETGGQGGDAGKTPDEVECSSNAMTAERIVPSIMLVIDGSSSMMQLYGETPDGGVVDPGAMGVTTRWQAVRQALIDPVDGVVPMLQGRVKFGLAVFGTMPTCPLPLGVIDPALDNAMSIDTGLPMEAPGFTTPTGPALDQVVDRLPDPSSSAGMDVGPQVVVLVTDGDPNGCVDVNDPLGPPPMTDYAPSIAAAIKLQQKHLRMFVIGVGDEAAKAHLQQMANLGAGLAQDEKPGAAVYYPEDPAALDRHAPNADRQRGIVRRPAVGQGRGRRFGVPGSGDTRRERTAVQWRRRLGAQGRDAHHAARRGVRRVPERGRCDRPRGVSV